MTDAFEALRADTIARQEPRMTTTPAPQPDAMNTVTPYLVVDGAAAAIDFYVAAFGAVEHHRLVGDDGRVGHAELVLGNSRIMLADEYPDVGAISPTARGGSSTSFTLAVPDVDAVFARALSLGATEVRPVADQFYGHRQGTLRDPFGHQWGVSSPIAGFDDDAYASSSRAAGFEWQQGAAAAGEHDHQVKHHDRGDLYYFTLPTADLARAKAFFGAVLGWRFDDPQSGHASNISAPPGGLHPGNAQADLWFAVPDIHAAVATVRELGGTATEPVHYESGWSSECTDDQGARFCLSVPAPQYTR